MQMGNGGHEPRMKTMRRTDNDADMNTDNDQQGKPGPQAGVTEPSAPGVGLRSKINAIFVALTGIVLAILTALEIDATRSSVREEMEASSRIATHLLIRISQIYAMGDLGNLAAFLDATGRVRANDITLYDAEGKVLHTSPASRYKTGRDAPDWYAALIMPPASPRVIPLNGARLVVAPDPSRAVLDGWDNLKHLLIVGVILFLVADALVIWLISRWLAPLEVIRRGLAKMAAGEHNYRLPALPGKEAGEIGKAFNRMADAVEENIQVRHASAEASARLKAQREFTQMLNCRIEEERASLARELHDELGQSLTAIRSITKSMLQHPDVAGRTIEMSVRMLFDTAGAMSDAMHRMIPRLRPLQLDDMGLMDAVRDLAADFQVKHPAIRIELHCENEIPHLPDMLEISIYRIVQEALTNVARHAGATRVDLRLDLQEKDLHLRIADNGSGDAMSLDRPGHYGVRGMRERAEALGGNIAFGRAKEGGLEIVVVIPVKEALV